MEIDDWAILNEAGEVIMVCRWDGDPSTWPPPPNTTWVRRSELPPDAVYNFENQ